MCCDLGIKHKTVLPLSFVLTDLVHDWVEVIPDGAVLLLLAGQLVGIAYNTQNKLFRTRQTRRLVLKLWMSINNCDSIEISEAGKANIMKGTVQSIRFKSAYTLHRDHSIISWMITVKSDVKLFNSSQRLLSIYCP